VERRQRLLVHQVAPPSIRQRFPNRAEDTFIAPAGVADIAAGLVCQDRTAWSFEVEARPYAEKW
jgi:hypothetical protein